MITHINATLIALVIAATPIVGMGQETRPSTAPAVTPDVAGVFAAQRTLWSRMRTIDISYTYQIDELNNLPRQRNAASFQMKGKRYRFEDHLPQSSGLPRRTFGFICAFDGEVHHSLDKADFGLHIDDAPSAMGYWANPLTVPYQGLFFEPAQRSFATIRDDPAAWDEVAKVSRMLGPSEVRGRKCIVVERTSPTIVFQTFFAQDFDLLPIRYQAFNAERRVIVDFDVLEIQQFETPGGNLYVPMESTLVHYTADGSGKSREFKYSISRESIRVNRDLADATFNIPYEKARYVQDWRVIRLIRGENR